MIAGMRIRSRIGLTLAAGVAAATLAVAVVPSAAGASGCGVKWGSLPKSTPAMTGAELTGVRPGRHDCFDRLVFDLAGRPVAGYDVRYVDVLRADGSGDVVPVAGGAVLSVTVRAPAYRRIRTAVAGYRTFRDVAWAGSFEGQTRFGLGVRARLPFRVLQLEGPGNGTRLVVDVAHKW
ncbi:MAG TPA: hypothetical protein VHF27_10655 [Acidimicrobiales bacterium]|nr:hypothetical protein [Acidimicrobiales bacterium]